MAQMTDRDVLADMQVEIATAGGQDNGAGDGRGPNDLAVDDPSKVLQHRIPVVSGLGDGCVLVGAEQHRVRTVDADETQLTERVGDRVRVVARVGGQRLDRVAGPLADALNAARGIALENRTVLGKGDLLRGVLCWVR